MNGCSNVGDNLFRGSCSSFVNYFKGKADTAIGESDAQFATTVAAAPVPSDAYALYSITLFALLRVNVTMTIKVKGRTNG